MTPTVPEEDERALSDLAQLSDQEADALASALHVSEPTLFLERLIRDIAIKSGIDASKIRGIMRVLSVFQFIRADNDFTVPHLLTESLPRSSGRSRARASDSGTH